MSENYNIHWTINCDYYVTNAYYLEYNGVYFWNILFQYRGAVTEKCNGSVPIIGVVKKRMINCVNG